MPYNWRSFWNQFGWARSDWPSTLLTGVLAQAVLSAVVCVKTSKQVTTWWSARVSQNQIMKCHFQLAGFDICPFSVHLGQVSRTRILLTAMPIGSTSYLFAIIYMRDFWPKNAKETRWLKPLTHSQAGHNPSFRTNCRCHNRDFSFWPYRKSAEMFAHTPSIDSPSRSFFFLNWSLSAQESVMLISWWRPTAKDQG